VGDRVPPADVVPATARVGDTDYELSTNTPVQVLHRLTGWAVDAGVELDRLTVARPSLEDAYLELTGETAERGDA
jgi:ABC-2 type transport system ATP-binding protein